MKLCLVFLSIVVLIEAAPPQLFYVSKEPQPQESAINNKNSTKQDGVNGDLKSQQQIELNDESVEIDDSDLNQESVYYIYHPTGILQRIVYLAKDDPAKMAYTARFKYENVVPIREPIYTYDPKTLAFQQLVF